MRMRYATGLPQDKWPRGLLGMIAVVVAVEAFVTYGERTLLGVTHWDWRLAGQAARTTKAVDAKVLCFGDSLVKYAVQPRVLGDRLGLKAYNLAIGGGLAPSSYFLLQRVLGAGARPSVVVVGFAPTALQMDPGTVSRNWSELLSFGETIDLALTRRDFELFGSIVARQVLPSLRLRDEIRNRLRTMRRRSAPARERLASFLRNRSTNDGALLLPPSPIMKKTAERFRQFFGGWFCAPMNAVYLERFLALAEAHGIPVVWLLTPAAPELQVFREQTGFEQAHTAFVSALQGRHRNVTVVDARRLAYGDEFYVGDPLHLNCHGALGLSDDLAAVTAGLLTEGGTSRWVALPKGPSRMSSAKSDPGVSARRTHPLAQPRSDAGASAVAPGRRRS